MQENPLPTALTEDEPDINVKRLLQIHAGYRVLLALLLLTMLVATWRQPIVGSGHPLVFIASLAFYGLFSGAVLLLLIIRSTPLPENQILLQFVVDCVVLSAFNFSSGATDPGLGLLLVITIAASNVILPRQAGLFIAAFSTVLILSSTLFRIGQNEMPTAALLPAGLLGIAFFITSGAIQALSQRIKATQILAESQQKDIFQLQAINERIVQRMRTGVVILTRDGMIQLMNRAASELLAFPDGAETRLPIMAPPGLQMLSQSRLESTHYWLPPGSQRQLQVGAIKMEDSDPELTMLFLEDSGKIAARAQELKLASLGRFTASIAHEIRNPLGAISHAAQLLTEPEEDAAGSARLAEIIVNHCNRLNGVIENVLELSRRRATDVSEVDLIVWLQRYIEERCAQLDKQAAISLTHDDAVTAVTIDASQLRQVIDNLVDNGLEFSERNTGKRSLRIHVHGGTTSPVTLLINDDGAGISTSDAERLFEPFFTTKTSGNGLGLYIARELCEANNILITGGNATDGGAEFKLIFTGFVVSELAMGET